MSGDSSREDPAAQPRASSEPPRAPRPAWSEFRAALEGVGFRPSRQLGQNFLLDENAARAIARDAQVESGDFVLEVGPGCGFLSVHLAHAGVHLLAVEIDERLAPIAEDFLDPYPNARVVVADILESKHSLNASVLSDLPPEGAWHLVSNLPYSVSAPVLALCAGLECPPISMTVLIQDEVAQRLLAGPGTREWGPLTVGLLQSFIPERIRGLGPALFWPRPKVQSTVVRLTRRENLAPAEDRRFRSSFAARLLRQRRQSLARVLKDMFRSAEKAGQLLESRGIGGAVRADNLTPGDLWGLAEGARGLGWRPEES
ncbi:MAG TPA: ribosomal RNA small subunit methyltransferase A [Planctomycetes bacterium]|nr:ribosomal RNA small subunit methyltransferase A [Planctomycetota bacterium]HIK60177.1 ribosomal RNA small subunit methyltransferase A [Planctomycetota bacterium]